MWILQESLIGKQKEVKCGVIAIETLLGWTLIEKMDTTATKGRHNFHGCIYVYMSGKRCKFVETGYIRLLQILF